MKKFLFCIVALSCFFEAINAQVNYVATLQHGDAITQYYGGGAFDQAYNAAEDGDVITLSAGTFSFGSRVFRKGITVRGTGIDANNKTFISSSVFFCSEVESRIAHIEGIVFNETTYIVNNGYDGTHGKINFIKDKFSYLNARQENNPSIIGPVVRIYNSIMDGFSFDKNSHPDILVYNSFLKRPTSSLSEPTTSTFINCIVCYYAPGSNGSNQYLNYYNCIIDCTQKNSYWASPWVGIDSSVTCQNCISVNCGDFFNNVLSGKNNQNVGSLSDLFTGFSGSYTYGETFELTDEAKETYLGTDGTQVGMQGGLYPYTSEVPYPIITKFESTPETTKDGILTINVQVDGK